jgi:hypothetical protein
MAAANSALACPLLMRLGSAFAVLYSMGASVLLFGGLAGVFPYVLDAQDVTRGQWLTAAAPLFAITIALMAVIAFGLLRRRTWSRHMVMAHWAAVFGWGVLLWMRGAIAPSLALRVMAQAGALGLIAAWYFYRKKTVVAYFHALSQGQATGSAL